MKKYIYLNIEGHIRKHPIERFDEVRESLHAFPNATFSFYHNDIYSTLDGAKRAARQQLELKIKECQEALEELDKLSE